MDILKELAEALINGDDDKTLELTERALERDLAPKEILDEGLIAGMDVVGERFRSREIFLPDVLLAAKAMYAGMDRLKPLLVKEEIPSLGKVAVGTIQGDLHDIGKNLVAIMLKGAGFDVIDLGKDVPPEKFVETARKGEVGVIGMSALLTTTMPIMKRVIELLEEEGLDGTVKTIVGGAPVTEAFAEEIGADAYGFDASNAVERVRVLIGGGGK